MNTLIGIFKERKNADEAVSTLKEKGFETRDISIIMRDETKVVEQDLPVLEGAVGGATTGGVLGGLAGLLIGLGAITIPGIGALLIGGPLVAALGLSGAAATTAAGAATGVVAGGLVGGLVGLGVPEEEAKEYETRVREGAIVLAVKVDSGEEENSVRDVFESRGATQIRTI